MVAGGGSGASATAIEGAGATTGCGGGAGSCSVATMWSALVCPPEREESHTSLRSLFYFHYTLVARSWSLYGRYGGSCRGLRRRIVGAWCGLRLRWLLLLFATAAEAPEASLELG